MDNLAERWLKPEGQGAPAVDFGRVRATIDAGEYWSGDLGDNVFYGGSGNDTADGRAGNDLLFGGGGLDFLVGGEGADTLIAGNDDATLMGDAGDDVLRAGDQGASLAGGEGNDRIFGGAGDDEVYDPLGMNSIRTGDGADVVTGVGVQIYTGAGVDILNLTSWFFDVRAGQGNDQLSATATGIGAIDMGAGDDRVTLSGTAVQAGGLTGGAGHDQLFLRDRAGVEFTTRPFRFSDTEPPKGGRGFEELFLTGQANRVSGQVNGLLIESSTGAHSITLHGRDIAIHLTGRGADSVTFVGSGTVETGRGADSITINGPRHATRVIDAGDGGDHITLQGSARVMAGGGNDDLFVRSDSATAKAEIDMGAGNDTVVAEGAFGQLSLGAGADMLELDWGITGQVSLGAGADRIVWRSAYGDNDITVSDFNVTRDRIAIDGIDSLSDFTSATQKGGALVLHLHPRGLDPEYDGGIYLRLLGVTADQITDAIFT
ncbi:hypothetical protein D2N39_12925 [Gemmobacter lutimaris]|uniref:Calcium-binding protein n=1 Tax=Gemmobacter lutimaris TaxID=2306023 RepID=A0A398BM67_9RHOB|nr:hypothetical protein [Gemmobacter lutimaris]RID91595.1 hypothetical protein D2N39_12925 [Gemmobacter lutimaris]